jgi:hypothetical protein
MFYALNMVACLAAVVTPQSFDIEVPKVAPIVQGQAMEVEVFLTYRGKGQIRVDGNRYLHSCAYFLPKAWKLTPKVYMYLYAGPGELTVDPGDKIRQVVDLRRHYDLSETPGKYEVEIQCYMAGAYVADGPKLLHVSKRVKVPIVILPVPK